MTRARTYSGSAARWRAVQTRDRRADQAFCYAVRSTGVYCRPSCPSRRPRPENVRYFDSPAEAERAGFRACRRCRPDAAQAMDAARAAIVAAACRSLASAEEPVAIASLAVAAGLSTRQFLRVFRSATGVTPRAYAAACRRARLQTELGSAARVDDAVYAAGFGASSRAYAQAPGLLGMTPGAFRRRAAGETIHYAVAATTLGPLMVAATARGICAIEFGESRDALSARLRERFANATLIDADARTRRWVEAIVRAVERPGKALALPLDVAGTAFQQRVWEALRALPPGSTISYGELATRIGQPRAVRAVARACASNPTALAIPCHRVLGADGGLAGYRWGIERKRELLRREARPRRRDASGG